MKTKPFYLILLPFLVLVLAACGSGQANQSDRAESSTSSETEEFSPQLSEAVTSSIKRLPIVEGPIPVTADSHPFSSMAYAKEPLNLEAYGYTEEEYFISGQSNIYEGESELELVQEGQDYKTRLMVRKPKPENFSGRVYIEIYNASNGYDIEDMWRRSYDYYMENGHVYIGVTSKPINVVSLKKFDPDRYESLNWASQDPQPLPVETNPAKSIDGMEEGLVWDMLSQLGNMVKSNQAPFLADFPVEDLYLTGQSQSAVYLNSYVYFFHPYVEDIYDGFLSVVGSGRMRDLRQEERQFSLVGMRDQIVPDTKIPYMLITSHGDLNLFRSDLEILEELSSDQSMIRHYELASSPHTDSTSLLSPNQSEIAKISDSQTLLDGDIDFQINSIKLAYYVNAAQEKLHHWASEGKEPPASVMMERNPDEEVLLDEHGNAIGGLRNPYVDVPVATYYPNETLNLNVISLDAGVNGYMEYFDKDKLGELYDSKEDYLTQFKAAVDQQVAEGWLLERDADQMIEWSKETADDLFDD